MEELSRFEEIAPTELDNAVRMIGQEWMLIVTEDRAQGRANAMTASWGCMGVLWNKPICVCFVRPQRHTYGLCEQSERFSIAFLGEQYRSALRLCGRESGRDTDKLKATGFTAETVDGVTAIAEAEILLVCRKLYVDDLKENCFLDPVLLENYKEKDYHRIYVCEIEHAYRRMP